MRNFKTMLLAATAAGVLLSGAAYAEPPDQGPQNSQRGERMQGKHEEFFKELGLSEDQKKALADNRKKHREEMKQLGQAMRDKMAQMHQELQKDNLDMGKINQIQGELKTLQGQMVDHRLAGILEVRKILTPDQFKKFSQKMQEHKEHWGDRRKEGREHEHAGPPDDNNGLEHHDDR
jgi:Spy/CpxP family protein refolding chaperone